MAKWLDLVIEINDLGDDRQVGRELEDFRRVNPAF